MAQLDSIMSHLTTLKNYISDTGVITGPDEVVNPLLEDLSELTHLDFGKTVEGNLTIGGTTITDIEQIDVDVSDQMKEYEYSSYFYGGGESCYGVVTTTGGEKLATIIAAALSGQKEYIFTPDTENKQYSLTLSLPNPESEEGEEAEVTGVLNIIIKEYSPTSGQLPGIYIQTADDPDMSPPLSMFNEIFINEEHPGAVNFYYEVYKGTSGDAYIKGFLSSEVIEIDEDTAPELFNDVTPATYTCWTGEFRAADYDRWSDLGYIQPDTNWLTDKSFGSGHCGGFAIAQMMSVTTTLNDAILLNPNDLWGVVFMGENELPIYVAMTGAVTSIPADGSYSFSLPEIRGATRNPDHDAINMGRIFAPSTGGFVARYASFLIMGPGGVYDSGEYRVDHGLCIK